MMADILTIEAVGRHPLNLYCPMKAREKVPVPKHLLSGVLT
jgi:hypothetical protein